MKKTWPHFSNSEIQKVSQILESGKINYWTGKEGRLFESEYAKFCKVNYGIAVSNGTVAIEMALKAIGIKKNDEVIVPSCTYVATASAVLSLGGNPVFADIDLNTLNVTVDSIKKCITKKTKAVIVVHLGGCPCEMRPIISLVKKKNLKLIEDCSQAHGAKYENKPVGSFGDLSTWSFCQDKIISTAGEGGMITTNNKKYRDFVWSLKDHGKSEISLKKQQKKIGFKWIHDNEGSNYRLTEIQSAVGRIQLKNINKTNNNRKKFAKRLSYVLSKYKKNIRVPFFDNSIHHAWYRFYVFIEINNKVSKNYRDRLLKFLNANQIQCITGSCAEVYREKVFRKNNLSPKKRHKNAMRISDSSLAFIIHPDFNEKQIRDMCNKIDRALSNFFK